MRGHANFAEYVPLILVMMALLEYQQVAAWQLHAIGATLVFARVIHGIALSFTKKWFFGRFFGTVLTFTLLGVCGILCVVQGLRGVGVILASRGEIGVCPGFC